MSQAGTQVFFIPYAAGKRASPRNGQISQQKHAAREYHRKAKQRRQSTKERSASVASEQDENAAAVSQCPMDKLSPKSLLGASRLDPFNSYSVSNLTAHEQEMLDYSLSYQWKIFEYVNPGSSIGDMKRHVLRRINHSETSLFSIVFAGASHWAHHHPTGHVPTENLMLRLSYKTKALRQMSQEVDSLGSNVPNETLYDMLSLSSHGKAGTMDPIAYKRPKEILANAHELDYYARLPTEYPHFRILSQLLKDRGGLPKVTRPGFAVVMNLVDVLASLKRLDRPTFPLLTSTREILDCWRSPQLYKSPLNGRLGTGFLRLPETDFLTTLKPILGAVVKVTLGYDSFRIGDSNAPSLHQILEGRNAVVHDLLCLPMQTDKFVDHKDCLARIAHIATLAYTCLVLYPLPYGFGPHEMLAQNMFDCLDSESLNGYWTEHLDFLVWTLLIAAMIGKHTSLRLTFIARLRSCSVLREWSAVSKLLTSYLWLEDEIGRQGQLLWAEVVSPHTVTTQPSTVMIGLANGTNSIGSSVLKRSTTPRSKVTESGHIWSIPSTSTKCTQGLFPGISTEVS